MRLMWGCLVAALLSNCGTDTFGSDAGYGDDGSADGLPSLDAGVDVGNAADAGDGASLGGGDARTDGPSPSNPCPFDGGVVRPSQCGGTGANMCDLGPCCIAFDGGVTCATAVCSEDSFPCFASKDCALGGVCCLTTASVTGTCPLRIGSPASTLCTTSCGTGQEQVCLKDQDCNGGFCSPVQLGGFAGSFTLGICR